MEIKEGYVYHIHIHLVEGGILPIEVLKDNGNYLVVRVDGKEDDEFPKYLLESFLEKYTYDVEKAEVNQSVEPIEKPIETKKDGIKPKTDTPSKFWFYIMWPISLLFLLSLLFVIVYGIGSCTYDTIKDKVNHEPKIHVVKKREQAKDVELTEAQKDSLHKDHEKRKQWVKDNSLAIICDGDSIYHTTTLCDSLSAEYPFKSIPKNRNLVKYHLSTVGAAERNNYKECKSCSDIEGAYWSFEDGELIDRDDADEYCSHNN